MKLKNADDELTNMDNSFLHEFRAAESLFKKRQKILIGLLIVLFMASIFGSYKGINAYMERKVRERVAKAGSLNQVSDLGKTPLQTSPTPTPSHTTTPTSPTTASTPAVDINALNAKSCKNISDSATNWSKGINKLYYDAWKSWGETYIGQYDSQEALESREPTVAHTKSVYLDFRNQFNSTYMKVCGGESGIGSIADVMYEPDYSAWK